MSFRTKILFGFLVVQALLVSVLVGAGIDAIRTSNLEALRDHAIATADLFAQVVAAPVLASDLAGLQEVTRVLGGEGSIAFVRVTGLDGTILSEAGALRGGREHEGDVIIATSSIVAAGQAFGTIEVGVSTAWVDRVVEDTQWVFTVAAVVGFLLSVLLAGAAGIYLGRRLDTLSTAAREVAEGNLGHQVAVTGSDELAKVAEAFNRMSSRLNALYGELADSDRRFQAVSRNIPGAIYQRVVEPGGKSYLTFVSEGAEALLGVTPEKLIADPDLMREIIHPDDVEGFFVKLKASVENGTPFNAEYRVQRDDAPAKWVRVRASARDREDGAVVLDGLMLDVTGDKEVEAIKNEFVAVVNHELRTPLTSIQGALALIAQAPDDAIDLKYRHMVEIAARNGERLAQLVNDILDMEKISSGKMELHREVQPVMPLIEEALEATQPFARSLGKSIAVVEAAPGARADVDGNRIVQVLTNFLSNAAKFEAEGGTVEIAVRQEYGKVHFAVADHGEGIPPEFRDRLFEKFAQAGNTLTRRHEGTGLGLSIAKALVDAHGGEIGFNSEPGVKTTFWFEVAAE